jgi:hypothetical protein
VGSIVTHDQLQTVAAYDSNNVSLMYHDVLRTLEDRVRTVSR